jgi:hypothetical protein
VTHKRKIRNILKEKWECKVIHGQYIRSMDRQLVSEEDTFLWLSRGDVKGETESEIIAAQYQALQTKYYGTKILQMETDSKCTHCKQLMRVCAHLHFNICKVIVLK